MIKEICYIFAACKEFSTDITISPTEKDLIIAADGGYDILKQINITPDILLGDFDSIEELPNHKSIIKHPSEKDDTDTFLAYKLGFDKGYRNFVIIGGIGGRIDHTIANIKTLSNIAECGGRGFLVGNNTVITVIKDKIEFSEDLNGYISVFATEKGTIITENGLKYTVRDSELPPDSTLGTSNEFVGERACISVKKGSLQIIWYENHQSFIKNIDNYVKKEL